MADEPTQISSGSATVVADAPAAETAEQAGQPAQQQGQQINAALIALCAECGISVAALESLPRAEQEAMVRLATSGQAQGADRERLSNRLTSNELASADAALATLEQGAENKEAVAAIRVEIQGTAAEQAIQAMEAQAMETGEPEAPRATPTAVERTAARSSDGGRGI